MFNNNFSVSKDLVDIINGVIATPVYTIPDSLKDIIPPIVKEARQIILLEDRNKFIQDSYNKHNTEGYGEEIRISFEREISRLLSL